MTGPESAWAIEHRPRYSWENIQEPWIPRVLHLLLEFRNQRFNRTGDLNADINIRGNKKAALDYFESQGIPKADARNYLEGLDLSKNVRVETLNRGKQLWQYQAPGAPQGKWYSKTPNVTPDELGINPMGENRAAGTVVPKELSRYVTTEKVSVLRSTSAPANDFWSVKGVTYPAKGGGTQYFTPDSNIVLH